jgi:hypothetical protein
MSLTSSKLKTKHVLLLSVFVYFLVLLVNDGFMALDEYFVGITRYIPAQSSSLMTLVGTDDVKSPLQLLPMHAVAQLALEVGVTSPYWQYRIVIFVLGLISVALLLLAFFKFSQINKLNQAETNFLLLMFTFYFAAPFAFTRPMFESVAAPWLCLAGVWALSYDQTEKLKDLLWGVFFGSMAFVLRQQLGLCALVFIILPLLKKNWKHFFVASALGLLFFVLSGIPDYFIRGQFHFSLLNLTLYNYKHGSEYGNQSVLFYPALIFAVAFVPFLIKKYPVGFNSKYLVKYRSLWIILLLFVFLHSLFPQKWERFVVSVLPFLIFLVFPYLYYLQQNYQLHKRRLISLYTLNGVLFIIASFFPAQKNLIEMSLYLDSHPEIKKVYRIADTPGWITEAFILHKQFVFVDSSLEQVQSVNWTECDQALVVGEAQAESLKNLTENLKLKAQFDVNLIEQLAFKLNPQKNLRRVQLKLYTGCS